jgi:hypothetical protein
MNNYHDDSCNEPVEQVVIISINGVETEFFGDALTSPIHDAIAFLNKEQQKEMVV